LDVTQGRGSTRRETPRAVPIGCLGSATSFVIALFCLFVVAGIEDTGGEGSVGDYIFGIATLVALVAMLVFAILFLAGCIAWAWHRFGTHADDASR
jgi:hypothetical protein